ncbi:MAG: response regulator, partial [Planctomycetes bacterium]|nr:response regulator [Planctomycetota bacterium]
MPSAGRILIADDEPMFLETTAELLGYRDYRCDCARDAAEAAGLLSRNRYDLLISDIRMPGNPRLELIRALHEIAPGMPTILVTGNPSVDTAVAAIGLPVLAYMLKPIDFDELLGRVDQCMRKSRVAHRARDAKAKLAKWRQDLKDTAALLQDADDPSDSTSLDAFVSLGLKNGDGDR